MRTKRIFTLHVAMELKNMGHEIVRCEENFNDEKLNVYVFRATRKFYRDFNSLNKPKAV